MKPLFKSLLCFLLVLLQQGMSLAAKELATFYHYSSKEGLSCNYVHGIAQDENGFLWIATEFGLNRFDGEHFKNYFVEEYPSLFRNEIMHVKLLSNKQLVFGGNNGLLVRYNEKTDSFDDLTPANFSSTYYKGITGFLCKSDKSIFISTTNGVYQYDSLKNSFEPNSLLCDSTSSYFITNMKDDKFGRYWIGTFPGVIILDKNGKQLREYAFLTDIMEMITSIVPMDDYHFLLASSVGSVWLVEMDKDGKVHRPVKVETPFKSITSLLKDSKNRYWFGTSGNGLWQATYDNEFHFIKKLPPNGNAEDLKKIHALFEDKNGDIWIGTQNSGLWRYSTTRNSGSIHSSDIGFPLVDGTSFAETDDGRILVGADGHGFYLMSPDFHIIKQYQMEDGLSSNNVLSIKKDKDGYFWIALWGGIVCRFDAKTGQIKQIPYKGIDFPYCSSKVVSTFANGDLWVGMAGDGIYMHNKDDIWKKKVLVDSLIKGPDKWIEHICESKDGVRWIITSRTVWREENGVTKSVFPDIDLHQTHRPLLMLSGTCDAKGNLYTVGNQGVFKFSADGKSYSKISYLPSGQYASILIDKKGVFWTSGSNGILSFNERDSSYHVVLLDERCLSRNYFTCRASFQDSKGKLYFGSTEGFVVFDPFLIKESYDVEYLSFADLFIFGDKIKLGSEVLPKQLSETEKLVLNYDQTNLTISFDVIDFSGLNNVNASYRLTGLDKMWIDLKEKREIKISHIPPGNYELEVVAIKKGSPAEISKKIVLLIEVLPPWWATWWFRSLVSMLLVSLVFIFIYARFRHVVKQRELLQVMVAERTHELDESNKLLAQKQEVIERRNEDLIHALKEKDRLISVIAHDLKNPMFAIVGALDTVLKKRESTEANWKILKDVYFSAFNLQSVMVKLLEWVRGTKNDVTCNLKSVDIEPLIQEVLMLLKGVVAEKDIVLTANYQLTSCANIDPRMIATSIRNLISNAVKFTPKGGSINVSAVQNGAIIKVIIKDSGVGMTQDQINHLMEEGDHETTLGTENERGTGLGFQIAKDFVTKSNGSISVTSIIGEGTCVEISLPISDQLIESNEPKEELEEFKVNKDLLDGNVVMIVDDDPLILLHLKNLLEPYVQVLEAANGEDGLSIAKKDLPDIIISDVEMPILDGVSMYQKLQETAVTSNIPLIFLSARNEESDRLVGLSSGAIDYISKPFHAKELLMKLCNILHWRRQQQQSILTQNYTKKDIEQDMNPLLKQLLEIIANNYTNTDFSVDDMANGLAMSKSTLSRKLKSITDKTPIEILIEYRLYKAQSYLKEENKSVSDAAYLVGFNDPFYFSRKYKNYFGYPPSQQF